MSEAEALAMVISQAALLTCEIAGMQAENQHRLSHGNSIAYGDEAFEAVRLKYEATLGINAVAAAFREAKR